MAWAVNLSEEVRVWYQTLGPEDRSPVDRTIALLAERGNQLRMPHSKSLTGGLYELRFTCQGVARRVTYVFEPDRNAVTLTTFRKQRQNERAEVLRARRAQAARAVEVSAREAEQAPAKPSKINQTRRKR